MKEARLILAGILLLMLLPHLTGASYFAVGSLSFSLAANGNAHVTETLTDVNVTTQSINVTIYAKTPQNLIMTSTGGQFLRYSPYYFAQYTNYTVDTVGASSVLIQYDTLDLTNQTAGVWNFSINTAYNYTLILPANVTPFPNPTPLARSTDPAGQTILTMPAGRSSVSYFFDTIAGLSQYTLPLIGVVIGISGGSFATFAVIRRNRSRKTDSQKVIRAHPELRAEEQEVVSFLAQRNGEAMESEIREAFAKIPKTTMWRLLKRLEEAEVVTLEKAGNQNRVKLR